MSGVERTLSNTASSAGGSHSGDSDDQADQQHDTERSVTVPPTLLLTDLDNGTLILQGRPDGPRARLSPADAAPLRRELAAAFRRTELGPRDDQDNAR